jgi:ABC-type uncharacterized transport system YnjBCD ATPase subunit
VNTREDERNRTGGTKLPVRRKARTVPETAIRRSGEAMPEAWSWVETSVWTPRMVQALDNGVKGERWYSLVDKVIAPQALKAAFARVKAKHAGSQQSERRREESRAHCSQTSILTPWTTTWPVRDTR